MSICQNPECNNIIYLRRSDAKTCSSYCQKRNKFLKRYEYYKKYLKKYRKDKYEERKQFNSKRNKIHYLNNKGYYKNKSSKRRAIKLQAIPKFADLNKIKEIYKNCPKGYEVDHIIPLQGKNVSGLHIETNLQYLPMKENRIKGNKFIGVY